MLCLCLFLTFCPAHYMECRVLHCLLDTSLPFGRWAQGFYVVFLLPDLVQKPGGCYRWICPVVGSTPKYNPDDGSLLETPYSYGPEHKSCSSAPLEATPHSSVVNPAYDALYATISNASGYASVLKMCLPSPFILQWHYALPTCHGRQN